MDLELLKLREQDMERIRLKSRVMPLPGPDALLVAMRRSWEGLVAKVDEDYMRRICADTEGSVAPQVASFLACMDPGFVTGGEGI
jgi:hypothetical protein